MVELNSFNWLFRKLFETICPIMSTFEVAANLHHNCFYGNGEMIYCNAKYGQGNQLELDKFFSLTKDKTHFSVTKAFKIHWCIISTE